MVIILALYYVFFKTVKASISTAYMLAFIGGAYTGDYGIFFLFFHAGISVERTMYV